ncbi:sorting nexin-12 [Platysternon megacephalum]|uniref:Sorting nexin-12 n=1 Tax=Platysternon megacephalum TaxID=55544 RepID=A0A4D9F4B9_9SAUR|nr:sorting nexin-12 [Platysternon megacephalum]
MRRLSKSSAMICPKEQVTDFGHDPVFLMYLQCSLKLEDKAQLSKESYKNPKSMIHHYSHSGIGQILCHCDGEVIQPWGGQTATLWFLVGVQLASLPYPLTNM